MLNLNIDFKVEKISNGLIVTGIDSTRTKTYYKSLEDFFNQMVIEPAKEADEELRHYDSIGEVVRVKLVAGEEEKSIEAEVKTFKNEVTL